MAAYTCDKCGHMMLDNQLREEAKYSVIVADLRKLVEEWRDKEKDGRVWDRGRETGWCAADLEKLLDGGE